MYARPSNREPSSNGDRPIVDEQMTAHAISSPDAVAHRAAIGGETPRVRHGLRFRAYPSFAAARSQVQSCLAIVRFAEVCPVPDARE